MDIETLIASWEARRKESEQRFREHFPDSDDILAIVLRGHLLVEEFLDRLNRHCFHFPEYYDQADLNFNKKVLIARAQVLVPHENPEHFFGPISKLNQLRNELAHNLDAPKLQSKAGNFLRSIEGRFPDDKVLSTSVSKDSVEKRLKSAISYLLGQMEVMDNVVEFMEASRQYGPMKGAKDK